MRRVLLAQMLSKLDRWNINNNSFNFNSFNSNNNNNSRPNLSSNSLKISITFGLQALQHHLARGLLLRDPSPEPSPVPQSPYLRLHVLLPLTSTFSEDNPAELICQRRE